AVNTLSTLKTGIERDYINARGAENAAKATTDRGRIEAAHTTASNAKLAAESKRQEADDQKRKVNRTAPVTSAVQPKEKALKLAKSNWGLVIFSSAVLMVVLFIEYIAITRRLPEGD